MNKSVGLTFGLVIAYPIITATDAMAILYLALLIQMTNNLEAIDRGVFPYFYTGDLMGPSINGLDKLIKMPYGCGEQNMLNFAPTIFVTRYLESVGSLTSAIKSKSLGFMEKGMLYTSAFFNMDRIHAKRHRSTNTKFKSKFPFCELPNRYA